MLELSLIICTRNRADMIADVLESAQNQTLSLEKYEVLIIDQSDNFETLELTKSYPSFRYIKLDSRGVSISRNLGIKESKGKILVYIDDDILFDEKYLENILNFFQTSSLNPDMIGGKTIIKFIGDKPQWIEGHLLGILAHSDFGEEPLAYDEHPKHIPYTCNMAIKRECVEKIGFSEFISKVIQKFPINEDVLFALKVRNAGYNVIYNPNMFVYHRMPAKRLTFSYYQEKYFLHGQSDAYLYFILKKFSLSQVPQKLFIHFKRLVEGLILQNFKSIPSEKCYQKLRFDYNLGYIIALINILVRRGKIDENS